MATVPAEEPVDPTSTGRRILDEDKLAIISEIMRCAVCLELPKCVPNLQVHTCEKGHHFCSSCRKKLRSCAMCRGRFFLGRNFVVEELIMKLGSHLGVAKEPTPPPNKPAALPKGQFLCFHQCTSLVASGNMLKHIRKVHFKNLVDNVRSNPYNGRFDWVCQFKLSPNTNFSQSIQISDFGLFTVLVRFTTPDLLAWVCTVGDISYTSLFRYHLALRMTVPNEKRHMEFSISDAIPVAGTLDTNQVAGSTENHLCVKSASMNQMLEVSNTFQLVVSIWRKSEIVKENDFHMLNLTPESPVILHNDRKQRRNKDRNKRKRFLRQKLRRQRENTPIPSAMSELSFEELHIF